MKCVLAGTSASGCCPSCGAPWERVMEKHFVPQADVSLSKGIRGAPGQKPMDPCNHWEGVPRGSNLCITTGWQPTCTCSAGDPVPSIVFDPFGGSGTTAVMAAKLGRAAISIDLSPDYVEMQRRRILQELGMLVDLEVSGTASSLAG